MQTSTAGSIAHVSSFLATKFLVWAKGTAEVIGARESDSLVRRLVVVVGLLLKFVLDVVPDGVAGFYGLEEAFCGFGDGFEVADEGGADGVVLEEGLKTRVCGDVAVSVGEEVRQVFFEVCRGHRVEVGKIIGH
jgi:hypothetical protein